MSQISIPTEFTPVWAREVSEEKWKEDLLQSIRSRQPNTTSPADEQWFCQLELSWIPFCKDKIMWYTIGCWKSRAIKKRAARRTQKFSYLFELLRLRSNVNETNPSSMTTHLISKYTQFSALLTYPSSLLYHWTQVSLCFGCDVSVYCWWRSWIL